MSEKVLITKELRLRITELEYEDLPPEAYMQEIQRIYIEETGEPLPAEIELFISYQSDTIDNESEYKGTAIRFYSKDNEIDEIYIVSEGTQGLDDWLYNVEALVAGRSFVQVEEADNFMDEALDHFQYEFDADKGNYNIPIVGLGHSQAHNTNATAYLVHEKFTSVYGVNSAQLNYFQLFRADPEFEKYLEEKYPILKKDRNKIIDLNTEELKQHAMDFYADKADNIVQERSIQDPLYAVSSYPGFFPLGEENEYTTDSSVPGLRESFDKIDGDYLKQLQGIAIVYALSEKGENNLQVVDDLLDIDVQFLINFEKYQYVTQNKKLSETIVNLDENLPKVSDMVYKITNNNDSILTELEQVGYITSAQKNELMSMFSNVEKHLIAIEEEIANMSWTRDIHVTNKKVIEFIVDVPSFNKIQKEYEEMMKELEVLKGDSYQKIADKIIRSHGIAELLDSMAADDQKYVDNELYIKNTKGSTDIWISLSVTGRICGLGKLKLLAKKEKIEDFKKQLESKVYEVFEEQRTRANTAVDYIEANPNLDREFLYPHGFSPSFNRTITRIDVHENIPRFKDTSLDMTEHINKLNTSVEKGHLLIQQYRETVESLFVEEDNIAEQIDFMEGVYLNG